ncbi:MAG: hypothetical protein GXO23_02115 [Crenarchaeota archaeon]|nr:hypothetical protein [Thermoproteota archaeon]
MRLRDIVKRIFGGVAESFKERSGELVRLELRELENAFVLLVISPLIGLPGPSTVTSLRLLPLIERELAQSLNVSRRLDDMLAEMLGYLDIT